MKRIFILIAITLFCGVCLSQNPGYMGHHVMFNAEGSLSPSWLSPNPLSQALNNRFESQHTKRYLGLNYFLSPNVEVIVWKKGTVGAGYNYYNSPFEGLISRYYEHTNPYDYNDYYLASEDYDFNGNVVAHGFNVFYKQYVGDTRAPLGYYFKFTFDGYFYNYQCEPERPQWIQYFDEHPDLAGDDYCFVGKDGKGSAFGLKAEFGYDYLFFNRLKLSMGITFGTTFSGYKYFAEGKDIDLYYNDHTTNLSVKDYVDHRILNAYWFGLKFGIGFLAF